MTTKIHPTAIIEPGAHLGADVSVGAYSIIGPEVRIGARTKIASHVVIEGHTTLGEDNEVHPFVNLGGPPQHTAYRGEDTQLIIGDRNMIRELSSMNRATAAGDAITQVGSDGFYMIESHVGHDCKVGDHVVMSKAASVAGHCIIGDHAIISGLAALHQYCRIGRHAFVGGGAIVVKDVIPYGSVWGNHAHLEGLNLVGLKRRGFTRETINTMRAAYRLLFADEGTFQERLEEAAHVYGGTPEVMEILDFIRADANRPLCLPEREV